MTKLKESTSNAWTALALLLGINLFNYIDRQVLAALEPEIRDTFFLPTNLNAMATTGAFLGSAFLVTYMLAAPALGWLADRFSRWLIIGCAVILWSLASGASGLAGTFSLFSLLVCARILVGIGEGAYGPAAPTILADHFPLATRGRIIAIFCAAIPVGSALGYILAGSIKSAHLDWTWAFYLVTPPGLLLGVLCFTQRDPRSRGIERPKKQRATWNDYRKIFRARSYLINTFAQTATTFALGGLAFWMAEYLNYRGQSPASGLKIFGVIAATAGLISTLLGGWVADRLRGRFGGAYFLVSGVGMLLAFPFFVTMLFVPFPVAWIFLFAAVFFAFLNTGPSNTAIANVSLPPVRATAFALNILVIHALGDVLAFPTIGFIGGHTNMTVAFLAVSAMMLVAGVLWLMGMQYLAADTAAVEAASAKEEISI